MSPHHQSSRHFSSIENEIYRIWYPFACCLWDFPKVPYTRNGPKPNQFFKKKRLLGYDGSRAEVGKMRMTGIGRKWSGKFCLLKNQFIGRFDQNPLWCIFPISKTRRKPTWAVAQPWYDLPPRPFLLLLISAICWSVRSLTHWWSINECECGGCSDHFCWLLRNNTAAALECSRPKKKKMKCAETGNEGEGGILGIGSRKLGAQQLTS